MAVVCIDTQILFWAILREGTDNSQLIRHATDFMAWLEKQQAIIYIPTIVIGEMLVAVPDEARPNVLAQFKQDWMIIDYDLRAASIFAQMRREHIANKRIKDLRHLHSDITRKELSADAMIIATALAHGADTLYSYDQDMLALAEGWIRACNFLEVAVQLSLPETDEANDADD